MKTVYRPLHITRGICFKLASPRSKKSNLYSKWEGLDRDNSDYHNNRGQTKSWTLKLLCGGGGMPLVWWWCQDIDASQLGRWWGEVGLAD